MDYKEKLRLAKEALDSGSYDKDTIEYIFPELKESEDEKVRKHLISLFEKFVTLGVANECETSEIKVDDILYWLEKQGEQKPAWSEEDINMFGSILSTLGICANNPQIPADIRSIHKKEESWFNELYHKAQPKQEWSEEDEKMLTTIVDYIISDNVLGSKYIDFLKSLRPQSTWKPTEQQMKVLNEVINFAADHGTMRWNDYIYNVLKSLREQLKKLK